MSTIPDYPTATLPLVGDELLAAWQNGRQTSLPLSLVLSSASAAASAWAQSDGPPDPNDPSSKSAKTWVTSFVSTTQELLDAIMAAGVVFADPNDALANESDGFSIDFTNANDNMRVVNKVGGVVTRSSAMAALKLGLGSGIPTRITNPDGTRSWAPHNLYTGNSTAPGLVNKNVTVVVGQTYVVAGGNGSTGVTLSNAATQVVAPGATYSFVATTATLTMATAATAANIQLCLGTSIPIYIATTNASVITAPISWDVSLGCYVLLVEPRGTNSFLNSLSPVTQTISLAAGTYTVWLDGTTGTDSIVVSGGPAGSATPGVPFTFTLASTTSVTFAVTGAPTHVQVENGSFKTSQIITFGAAQTRFECNPNVLFTATTAAIQAANTAGNPITVSADYAFTSTTGTLEDVFSIGTSAGTDYLVHRLNAGNPQIYRRRSSDAQVNWSLLTKNTLAPDGMSVSTSFPVLAANTRQQATVNIQSGQIYASSNGVQIGSAGTQLSTLPTPGTALWLGTSLGSMFLKGPMRIRRIAIVAGATGPDRICSRFTQVTRNYRYLDAVATVGQSNGAGNGGGGLPTTTDAPGPKAMQWMQVGGLVSAVEPLDNPIRVAGAVPFYIGAIMPVVRDYLAVSQYAILPECIGNTGFGGPNQWGVGKAYHNNAISAFDSLRTFYPNARLRWLFVSRGEYDSIVVPTTQAAYAAATDAEIQAWRNAYDPALPVVIDQPLPSYVAANAAAFAPVMAAIADTPNRLGHVAIVDETGAAANPTDPPHYSAAENRGPRPARIVKALMAA